MFTCGVVDHIHNRIMPKLSTPDRTIPEVHVIAYAVRARLQPTLLLKEMPQLIWGLGHVDFVRQAAVQRITELLALDDEFRESGRAGAFTPAERAKIEKTRGGIGEDMRRRFREILCGFCLYVGVEFIFASRGTRRTNKDVSMCTRHGRERRMSMTF